MRDEFDVEKALRQYDAGPGPATKASVMEEFSRSYGARTERIALWRRPVPLYRAAIVVLLLAGVSFAAGHGFGRAERTSNVTPASSDASQAAGADVIDWVPADSDCL